MSWFSPYCFPGRESNEKEFPPRTRTPGHASCKATIQVGMDRAAFQAANFTETRTAVLGLRFRAEGDKGVEGVSEPKGRVQNRLDSLSSRAGGS